MRQCLIVFALAAAVLGCDKVTPIVENGRSDWKIVHGSAARDKLAASDFQEIFEKATGIQLKLEEGQGQRSRSTGESNLFLIGAEFLGADASKLANEQTLVIAKDGNIILAGGGIAGTCYAVYDFCEKYFGYRMYGWYKGAEIVKKVTDLKWDGKPISTKPAFTGYRIDFHHPTPDYFRTDLQRTFFRRNRANQFDRPLTSRILGAQHGLFMWVPAFAKDYGATWVDKLIGENWEPMYEKHPEYFSLDRKGKRTCRGQLCFANREMRKLLISRFRALTSKKGPGIYMVGSNDSHNERYCWCEGCQAMMAKYKTNGGPLWDFILELCDAVKDLKDVYVTSLVYKGPEQTELAPTGIVFPENFVADLGFLNSDRPPSKMRDIPLPDGRVYNRIENIRAWKAIAQHVSWWYYGGPLSLLTYRRMQMELRELLANGVDSLGACGMGGEPEFKDLSSYLFFQLARDPEMDADAAAMDIFRHKFGAAAETVFTYLKELEEYEIGKWKDPRWSFGTEDNHQMVPLEGEDMARWQRYFDKALEQVKDDPKALKNVKIARIGLDCWSVAHASRIRNADPAYGFDAPAAFRRATAMTEEAVKCGQFPPHNKAAMTLKSLRYYATLKTDRLPPELAKERPEDVRLYLPEDPPYPSADEGLTNDVKAAAGVAMVGRRLNPAKPICVELRDANANSWVTGLKPIDPKKLNPDTYTIVSVGTGRVPPYGMLVLAGKWGTSLDMRSIGRFHDPSYYEKRFEYFVSARLVGDALLCDRVYLVDRGMPGEERTRAKANPRKE